MGPVARILVSRTIIDTRIGNPSRVSHNGPTADLGYTIIQVSVHIIIDTWVVHPRIQTGIRDGYDLSGAGVALAP